MMAEVADALDHAHEHGVIHRDVKPSNLLLGPDGRLSINDFGLARMLEQPGMTVSGEFVGSPLYMSPEQITAGRVALDHRTDIYSLGATLYELLTLQPPFPGQSRDQVLSQILHKEALRRRKLNRKVPIDLDTICMKAIDKDPDKRYQTAGKLAEDLRMYVNRYAISAKRTSPVGHVIKLVRRNRTASLLVLALIVVISGFSVFMVRESMRRRAELLDQAIQDIYASFFHGETNLAEVVERASDQGATENQMTFFHGLEEVARDDHRGAQILFARISDSIAAQALAASELMYTGSEVGYMNALAKIDDEAAETYEDKLFLGVANLWGNPAKAYDLLSEASNRRPSLDFIETQLAEAARALATSVVTDLNRAEELLDEANRLTARRSKSPNLDTVFTRSTLLVDQAKLYERKIASGGGLEHVDYGTQLAAKQVEIEQFLSNVISAYDRRTEKAAWPICHVMIYLERDDDLQQLANEWYSSGAELNSFATHLLATYFARLGQYEKARFWFHLVRSGDQYAASQYILALIDILDSQSGRSLDEIREHLRSECVRKCGSSEASAALFYDALFLYLLGDDAYLDAIGNDALLTKINADGGFEPIVRYFKMENRTEEDAEQLLAACGNTDAPNFSVMHARFALGVEAIVNDRGTQAREHFQACLDGRQYMWFAYRFSEIFLKHEELWKSLTASRAEIAAEPLK